MATASICPFKVSLLYPCHRDVDSERRGYAETEMKALGGRERYAMGVARTTGRRKGAGWVTWLVGVVV